MQPPSPDSAYDTFPPRPQPQGRARGSPCRCRHGCASPASRRSCPRARSSRRAGRRAAGHPAGRLGAARGHEEAPARRPARVGRESLGLSSGGVACDGVRSGSRSKGGTLTELRRPSGAASSRRLRGCRRLVRRRASEDGRPRARCAGGRRPRAMIEPIARKHGCAHIAVAPSQRPAAWVPALVVRDHVQRGERMHSRSPPYGRATAQSSWISAGSRGFGPRRRGRRTRSRTRPSSSRRVAQLRVLSQSTPTTPRIREVTS